MRTVDRMRLWALHAMIGVGGALISGCTAADRSVETALNAAGQNRASLEKVLRHFELSGDNEMAEGARFIIANMPGHAGYDTLGTAPRRAMYRAYAFLSDPTAAQTDSLARAYGADAGHRGHRAMDVTTLDSAFIVDDIEAVFEARRRWPWAKAVPFDVFCRYVLPYRLADEPLVGGWRRKLQRRYEEAFDSLAALPGMDDALTAANALLGVLDIDRFKWVFSLPDGPRIGPDIVDIAVGTCQDRADFLVYFLRAAGIPCATDKTLVRGEGNTPHSWAFVAGSDGLTYIKRTPDFQPADSLDVAFTKIHREEYAASDRILAMLAEATSPADRKRLSALVFLSDVTACYTSEPSLRVAGSDIPLPPDDSRHIVWLGAASSMDWAPVAPASAAGDSLDFGTVGPGCVAVAGYLHGSDSRRLHTVSLPFFTGSGNRGFIVQGDAETQATLWRKYTPRIGEFADRMVGGVVETSDSPSFDTCDTLLVIDTEPFRLFTSVAVSGKPRRYVRYRGPAGSYCNISEISFYGCYADTVPLTGSPIGSPPLPGHNPDKSFEKALDGDPYTSFDYGEADGGWTGLDLGEPRAIGRVTYTPRNRDNFIRKGDEYELFEWNADEGAWQSRGTAKAAADSVVFRCRTNSLLFLRNHTRGHDERIFIYSPGDRRQIFY